MTFHFTKFEASLMSQCNWDIHSFLIICNKCLRHHKILAVFNKFQVGMRFHLSRFGYFGDQQSNKHSYIGINKTKSIGVSEANYLCIWFVNGGIINSYQ